MDRIFSLIKENGYRLSKTVGTVKAFVAPSGWSLEIHANPNDGRLIGGWIKEYSKTGLSTGSCYVQSFEEAEKFLLDVFSFQKSMTNGEFAQK